MAKVSETLGHKADAKSYTQQFAEVRKAFRTKFYDAEAKVKSTETQTSYLLPLAFDLFDGDDISAAEQHLITEIEKADTHLRTGFLGTPLLAPVLQKMGRSDLMYEILFKQSYPSWFYSINNGASTTWERWNSYSLQDGFSKASMNSLNHYAYGAVAKWFYEGILGINAAVPGFKEINIKPVFNHRLSQAQGAYKTPYGEVSVNWTISKGQELSMTVVIPNNTTASIELDQVDIDTLTVNGQGVTKANLHDLAAGTYQLNARVNL
jgi:alpha-L-rhamnosidase